MKLKSLLKVTCAPKLTVTVESNRKYYSYDIDYTSNEPKIVNELFTRDTTTNCIPKEVLEREVTYVNTTDKGCLVITCATKETIRRLAKEIEEERKRGE